MEKPENISFDIKMELLQPWSTFVMKTRLPPVVLERMLKITDEVLASETAKDHGPMLAGQIDSEFMIEHKYLEREQIMVFFHDMIRQFVVEQTCQFQPFNQKQVRENEWFTKMLTCWVVSQKDNEYNPAHIHTECHISTVMYLKIPEYLPNRKSHRQDDDGAITFTNNAARDPFWGRPTMTVQPEVGDFFLFPSSQTHMVYPFRTQDGKGERRSVSFNAVFSSKDMAKKKMTGTSIYSKRSKI